MAAQTEHSYDPDDGPRDRSLRVGDAERDAVGAILRQRHLEGRLDTDEFQTRLDRCMRAKTYAELDELIVDFPRPERERPRAARARPRRGWPVPFAFLPLALIAVIAFGGHAAWLAIPLVFFFVVRPLLWRGWWGCGPRYMRRV
jgi:hypothetical protein